MVNGFLFLVLVGLALYTLSWSVTPRISGPVTHGGLWPLLVGLSGLVIFVAFANSPATGLFAPTLHPTLDLPRGGWDAVEVGVFGALCVASLPFFILTQTRPSTLVANTALAGLVSLGAGLVFITTSALWVMFMAFEALLLSALYILLLTSKSERARDAALEMFLWTLVGSAGLLTGLGLVGGLFTNTTVPGRWGFLSGACFVLGFGVKVPVWPSTSWLLKAHVEASVEFSILLSGYIVKVGVLGLYRTLLLAEAPTLSLLTGALAVIGLCDACSRLPAQRDLKRIVALTTVIEMNWAVLALSLGGAQQEGVAGFLCLAHCCTTTTEFFIVEALTKRFGTRDISYIGGIALSAPLLWVLSVLATLVTIGFPGTSLFWAKYAFFTGVVATLPGLGVGLGVLFLLLLPMFFIRLWSLLWFGVRAGARSIPDLSAREVFILGFAIGLGALLGVMPGLVF